jgi:hypothetical protein
VTSKEEVDSYSWQVEDESFISRKQWLLRMGKSNMGHLSPRMNGFLWMASRRRVVDSKEEVASKGWLVKDEPYFSRNICP